MHTINLEELDDYGYILEDVYNKEFDTVEEQKEEMKRAEERMSRLNMIEEIVKEAGENAIYTEENEEEDTNELTVVGELEAKKIKVVDREKCKNRFASFREARRIKSMEHSLEKLESSFPLKEITDINVCRNTNKGAKQLQNIKKNLKKCSNNKELYSKYENKYKNWEMIISAYDNIVICDFEDAKKDIEKIEKEKTIPEQIKKELATYLEKQERQVKEKETIREEEKTSSPGYTFAKTVEGAKYQYGWWHLRSQFGFGDIEYISAVTLGMLKTAIENGEPEEVIEYRVIRTKEILNKFLKKASLEDYNSYYRKYKEIVASIETKYKKKEETKEENIEEGKEKKEEPLKEEPLNVNFNEIAQKVFAQLKQNANVGENVKNYKDCTEEIQLLQKFMETHFKDEKDAQKVEEAKLSLDRYQTINDFQKELCSKISTFSNPKAVMNKDFWDIEKSQYKQIVEEINANFTSEDVKEWFEPLVYECTKQIRITEDNFIAFRENGGKVPNDMSNIEKGKEIRKGFDKLYESLVTFVKNPAQIEMAGSKLDEIEQFYKKYGTDKNVFPNGETLEELLYPYTRENINEGLKNLNFINIRKKARFCVNALQKVQNSILLQRLEGAVKLFEKQLQACKSQKYDNLFNIDSIYFEEGLKELEKELQAYKKVLKEYQSKMGKVPEEVQKTYYNLKIKNAKEKTAAIEKKLDTLLMEHGDRSEIIKLQIELKDNYNEMYLAQEQSVSRDKHVDKELYKRADAALENNNLDNLNNIVDTLFEKRTELQEQLIRVHKELEKANESCKQYNVGAKVQTNIIELLEQRLDILKENAELYAVKSNEIATKKENEALEKELDQMMDSKERKEKETFYEEMAKMSDEELKKEGKKGTEERKKEEELEPIVISKMPNINSDDIQADAFSQRVNQMESILKNASTMKIDELEEKLVTEKYLVEQNKNLFTEEQLSYLNDLAYRGEILLSEQTLKKL